MSFGFLCIVYVTGYISALASHALYDLYKLYKGN